MVADRDADLAARLGRAYAAFSRGDFDGAVAEGLHPDFEYVPAGGLSPIRGAESFRSWMEPDAFESQAIEPLAIELNDARALVRQRTTARGAGSGIEIDIESWGVWTLDGDGRAIRLELFQLDEEADARRAAGL
jgi:SnoaL-like domain